MSEVKKIGLFSRLFKTDRENLKKEFVPSPIGMPHVKQTVKDGLVVNEYEFITDYGVSSDVRVDDYALVNLINSGITPMEVASCERPFVLLADNATDVFDKN